MEFNRMRGNAMNSKATSLTHTYVRVATFALVSTVLAGPALALGPDEKQLKGSIAAATEFLKLTQADDGSWTDPDHPGITALVVHSLLENGVAVDDPAVVKGIAHLKSHIKDNGGIYATKSLHRNYETAITLMAFQSANKDGAFDETIEEAVVFLKKVQWDYEEGAQPEDTAFGGSGYGKHQRPDLSNTTFFLEAMQAAGVPSTDPAVQNALTFISRCQNLESEHNTTPFATKVNDGGFYYTPAAGGTSQSGLTDNGGLRSYASMTYAGLKSMIYAGLEPDDQRVKAAKTWIREFYSLDENPGLGQQGLYYYYHTFAKTLSVLKVDEFEEADGTKHDWRSELASHLFASQEKNGSWVNKTDRWYEGDPNLVTAYGLLALKYCKQAK